MTALALHRQAVAEANPPRSPRSTLLRSNLRTTPRSAIATASHLTAWRSVIASNGASTINVAFAVELRVPSEAKHLV